MPSIFDELKAGLNSLLDRVAGDDEGPVPSVSGEQIRAQLEERAAARGEGLGRVHPIAKRAGSDPESRKQREQVAQKREAKAHREQADRTEREQRERDAAFEGFKRQAAAGGFGSSGAGGAAGASSGAGQGRKPKMGFGRDATIAKHYQTLGVEYGADFPTVKAAFRKMMRKYHPDMHSAAPEKQKAAAEVSRQMTEAYSALERHLEGK